MDHRRILLVEDDQEVLVAMSKFLERRGFSVVTANNARTALDAMGSELASYDLVLADVALPQLSGREILKTVKDLLPELPVVLLNGYGDPETRDELRALGATDLLHKPFSGDRLLDAIHQALRLPTGGELTPALS